MRAKVFLLLIALLAGTLPAHAANPVGLVLLHGKTETPVQFAKLTAALTDAGYAVEAPEMCWSLQRIFDKPLADCLKEVDAAVANLKTKGATKVVIGGASEGAIAAIDYGATHSGLVGVIAMAPVADPPDAAKYPDFAAAIKAAQASVKARKGDAPEQFSDLLGGEGVTVNATANVFLSFHGPQSSIATIRAVKGKVLPKLAVPLLWIAGTKDATQASTRAVFAAAPDNKLSSYVRVDADHAGTADGSGEAILAWLKGLG